MDVVSALEQLSSEVLAIFQVRRRELDSLPVGIKRDGTFLTSADIEIERTAADFLLGVDPNAAIIGEEMVDSGSIDTLAILAPGKRLWVIDPIDGTSQFIDSKKSEFCFAAASFLNGYPEVALIVAPELSDNREPIIAIADVRNKAITVNGTVIETDDRVLTKMASTTRSVSTSPSNIELMFASSGYALKTRTTSQSLDMLRTAVDMTLSGVYSGPKFDLFYRKNQKVWDGLPGLCFGSAAGQMTDFPGRTPVFPLETRTLMQSGWTFTETLMYDERLRAEFGE